MQRHTDEVGPVEMYAQQLAAWGQIAKLLLVPASFLAESVGGQRHGVFFGEAAQTIACTPRSARVSRPRR